MSALQAKFDARFEAASCSLAIGESRIRGWVVVLTAVSYFECKRVSVGCKTKCGRLFLTPGWFGLRISAHGAEKEEEDDDADDHRQ